MVGGSEGGVLRYMVQLTMGILAWKVAKINFYVNSMGIFVDF